MSPSWLVLLLIGCLCLSDAISLCTPFPYFDSHDHAVCPIDATGPRWASGILGISWLKGDACHGLGSDKFCTFTHPGFNHGLGISLVTTDEILKDLSATLTFDALDAENGKLAAVPPYEAREIPGKGIGLVASRNIRQGQLIMARTPAVVVDGAAFDNLSTIHLTQALSQAIKSLPQQHQDEYLQLSTHDDATTYEERVYKIFAKNNFRTKSSTGKNFHSTFTEGWPFSWTSVHYEILTSWLAVSRLNHDCRPNSGYHFDASTLSQKVYAARGIRIGEELSIAYYEYAPLDQFDAMLFHTC